ncbi:PaaI family thioesterase [Patulibacter sp. S7RM1-6]
MSAPRRARPTLEDAASVLAAQPFSALLGTRLVRFDDTGATLELPLRPEHLQQDGFAHGGILAYLADNALTFAGGTVLGPAVLTGGLTLDYLRPAPAGAILRADAEAVHGSGRQAVCRCDITAIAADGEALLCAAAQGTIVAVQGRRRGTDAPPGDTEPN